MKPILTVEEKSAVSAAILEAEKRTSGEIVPMIVRVSDAYLGAVWQMGMVTALLCAFCAYFLFPHWNPIWYLCVEFPGLFAGFLMGSIPGVKRVVAGKKVIGEEVHQRALEAFYRHRLSATREGTGILIFVSLLEHRVEIVADKGISAKVEQEEWHQVMEDFVGEIKRGNLAQGLIKAVEDCGRSLAKYFPAQRENIDELRNEMMIED